MGIILYLDPRHLAGVAKSYRVMDRSVKLILRLISLFQFPLLRPFLRELLDGGRSARPRGGAGPGA